MVQLMPVPRPRAFAFLQGPPGPLFRQLAEELRGCGNQVHRVNLSAGDRIDWPGPATNFRGRFSEWPVFLDKFLKRQQITDILLFGDCRPYHVVARRIATMRGIRIHVLEEGYLRPHWMTLELDGVNAHSRLRRDKEWFYEQARLTRDEDPECSPITASFRRRVRDAAWYYTAVQAGALLYPHYRNHRKSKPLTEAFGWGWKFLRRASRARAAERQVEALAGQRFFLHPLQLSGDYQIRAHSPFPDMQAASAYVLESFAAHAPKDVHLLIKAHPLDCSFFSWRRYFARSARQLGLSGRVHFIDGGDLDQLAAEAEGMVVVNSTSATLALRADRPVCVLGEAIYKVPGLTFDRHLDDFWNDPPPPEPGLYQAFRRVLVSRCMVRGGLASESAVRTLIGNMAQKLCGGAPSAISASHGSIFAKWSDQVGAR